MRPSPIAISVAAGALAAVTGTAGMTGCDLPAGDAGAAAPTVGSGSQPLLNGTIEGPDDDPGVIALANQYGPFCTGSMVTPRTVLTAAHCIDQFDPTNPTLGIFFGSDINDGSRVGVIGGATKPGWDGQVGPDLPNDVGLLILKQAQNPALPLPLNDRPPVEGESYRHVGFGVYDNTQPADGKKRTGTITITAVGNGIIQSGTADISICFGDSGGPGLVTTDGVEHIAGIHSYTSTVNGGCRYPAGDSRVDAALDWIIPWIDHNDPSCGPDRVCAATGCSDDPDCDSCGADGICVVCAGGEDPDCPSKDTGDPCQIADECAGDICTTWDGDFASKFCTESCSSDDDCPGDMECRPFSDQSLCYPTAKSGPAGHLGATCESGDECFSNLCDDSQCVIRCNIAIGFDCPADFTCTGTGDGENFYCRPDAPASDGGCAVGDDAARTSVLVLVLALLALVRRRAA